MNNQAKTAGEGWGKKLRAQFIAGVVVVVPIGASILILIWLFSVIDNILQPLVKTLWGSPIPGVGFVTTLLLIYLAGVVASNVVGKRLIAYGESLLTRVPVLRQLYFSIRQILESFSSPDKTGFLQVVLVEFPCKDTRAIGFVTNEITGASGEKLLNVLIPTSPNPTTGFLQVVREREVVRTSITVDDAIKMIISAGGITSPEVVTSLHGAWTAPPGGS